MLRQDRIYRTFDRVGHGNAEGRRSIAFDTPGLRFVTWGWQRIGAVTGLISRPRRLDAGVAVL